MRQPLKMRSRILFCGIFKNQPSSFLLALKNGLLKRISTLLKRILCLNSSQVSFRARRKACTKSGATSWSGFIGKTLSHTCQRQLAEGTSQEMYAQSLESILSLNSGASSTSMLTLTWSLIKYQSLRKARITKFWLTLRTSTFCRRTRKNISIICSRRKLLRWLRKNFWK